MLLAEVEKLDDECTKTKARLQEVEEELAKKCQENKDMNDKIEKAEEAVRTVDEARKVLKERDAAMQDILKIKLEIDKRDRVIKTLEGDIRNLKHEIELFKKEKAFNDVKISSMQNELRKQVFCNF